MKADINSERVSLIGHYPIFEFLSVDWGRTTKISWGYPFRVDSTVDTSQYPDLIATML